MSEKITVTLSDPVEYQGKAYADLTFRRLKVKDLVAADLVDGDVRKSLALFASSAGVPIGVLEELGVDDFAEVSEQIKPLLGKSAERLLGKAAETESTRI